MNMKHHRPTGNIYISTEAAIARPSDVQPRGGAMQEGEKQLSLSVPSKPPPVLHVALDTVSHQSSFSRMVSQLVLRS